MYIDLMQNTYYLGQHCAIVLSAVVRTPGDVDEIGAEDVRDFVTHRVDRDGNRELGHYYGTRALGLALADFETRCAAAKEMEEAFGGYQVTVERAESET